MRLLNFLVQVFPWAGHNRRPSTVLGSNGDTSGRGDLLGVRFEHVCCPRVTVVLGEKLWGEKQNNEFCFEREIKKEEAKSMAISTLSDHNSQKEAEPS